MPICTFISDNERRIFRSVSDADIMEIWNEVRELGDDKILIQEFDRTEDRWFRSPIKKTLYSMYIDYRDSCEVQVFNFAPSAQWFINTMVEKRDILNYLFGYRNGLAKKPDGQEKGS